jgi:N-acetylneuraminate synthase
MSLLVQETERAWQALGTVAYGVTDQEKPSMVFRRSLYVVEDVKAGMSFTRRNVRAIRPGYGMAPKYLDLVLGRKANRDIPKGTPLTWDIIG